MTNKPRVGVIFGGRNSEHEVSLKSARSVMEALDQDTYEIVAIGIDKQGRWMVGGDPLLALEQAADPRLLNCEPRPGVVHSALPLHTSSGRLPDETAHTNPSYAAQATESDAPLTRRPAQAETTPLQQLDVIVPVLHGMYGEDGALQGLLEIADVPYVGCGVLAASVGMDKGVMKAAFAAAGLPQVPYLLVRRRDWEQQREVVLDQIEESLRYPVFTKPANAGSSVGVSKCRSREELAAGLDVAAEHDRRLIIEQGVSPRELEVAVLGNDDPQASIVGEIIPANDWYDYADKYLEGRTQYLIPAPIDEAVSDRIREMAVAAFKAIDGAGLARVDFLLDKDSGAIYLNEVNTFPGFTSGSMYPKLWEATGLSYPRLLDRLIELAQERHEDRRTRE
ncbi:MAG TPA: D-alanine--D-alanine ligase family protein [Herpetosiphonaceae bacterium]